MTRWFTLLYALPLWAQVQGNAVNPRVLFVQTDTITVANTTAETSIVGDGQGSMTLAPNFLRVGTVLKIEAQGYHSSAGNPDATVTLKSGGITLGRAGPIGSGKSQEALAELTLYLVCRAAGPTGAVVVQGSYQEWHQGGADAGLVLPTPVSLDTTIAQLLNITFQWSKASPANTVSWSVIIMEQLR